MVKIEEDSGCYSPLLIFKKGGNVEGLVEKPRNASLKECVILELVDLYLSVKQKSVHLPL